MKTWKDDWETFVKDVARDFDRGMTNKEVSDKYCNQSVEWTGVLSKISFEEEPSAALAMPKVDIKLNDGRYGVVDYLGIVIGEENAFGWKRARPGMTVRIKTSILKGTGPFPGVEWADLGDMKGYISICTGEGKGPKGHASFGKHL